jgi:eukaryotic-like serine/threonine-protein kinase
MERVVGNYALERPLGGGTGSVWLAHRRDGRFEGRAAIKLLNRAPLDTDGALAKLEHANIARLIDAGVTGEGQPYLVLEYVEGEALDRWCESRALDVRSRVRLFLEVLAAVAHAHSRLVLLGDLKPANVLVTADGHVKLVDFGIATVLDAEEATTSTDIQALRALLRDLLPGELSGDLQSILHTQYQTVEAFADDLRRYLNGEPVRARSGSAWYRARKFVARNWIASGATAVVLIAMALATAVSIQQSGEAKVQRDRARVLSARSAAVIDFVNSMLADAAPSHEPVSVAAMMERSYSRLVTGNAPPDHEAAVLSLIAQFFQNNANTSRAEPLLARSLELTRASSDMALRATLLCQSAGTTAILGRLEEARALVVEGAKLAGDDDLAAVSCLETDAWIARAENDPDRSLDLAKRAQQRLRQAGVARHDWDAVLMARIADAYSMRGNTVEAERYYARSLARLAEIGRGESIATYSIRSRWAAIAAQTGDTLRALHDYEQLLQIVAASSLSGKPPAYLVTSRGNLLVQLARYPEALVTLDEAIDLARQSDNTAYVVIASALRIDALVSTGDVTRAARELQQLTAIVDGQASKDGDLVDRVRRIRARVAAAEGRLPEALATYSELIARKQVSRTLLARALAERADVYLKLGKTHLALADAERDLEVTRNLQRDKQYSSFTGQALAVLARCHQARGSPEQARAAAEEAAVNLTKTLGDDHPDTRWALQAAREEPAARRVRT